MKFSQIIKSVQQQQGISNSELARRLKVSKNRVATILQADNLTETVFTKALDALGVDIDIRIAVRASATEESP